MAKWEYLREQWPVQRNIHAKVKNRKTNSEHGTHETGNKHDKKQTNKNLNWGIQSKFPCIYWPFK